jgi:hypothetical protein
VTLRWVLIPMVEETARQAGHIDICRELIDGLIAAMWRWDDVAPRHPVGESPMAVATNTHIRDSGFAPIRVAQ